MFKFKRKPTWTELKILELQDIMDKNPPESTEFKAAQEARERLLKEGISDPTVKQEIVHVLGGLTLFAGSSALEATGFMVPTRWFQNMNLFRHK